MTKHMCSVNGCQQVVDAKGLCRVHYRRWRRHGDPTITRITRHKGAAEQRFWAKVEKTETCWNWTAATGAVHGYGVLGVDDVIVYAHRFAYELLVGPIPERTEIDHRCHNRRCVNPDHLRLATRKQNAENHNGVQSNNTSGVRGVSWSVHKQRWIAEVRHNGKRAYIGSFRNLDEAEAAVIAERNQLHTYNDKDRSYLVRSNIEGESK